MNKLVTIFLAIFGSVMGDVAQYGAAPTAAEYAPGVYPYNQSFNHAFGSKQSEEIDPLTAGLLVVLYLLTLHY